MQTVKVQDSHKNSLTTEKFWDIIKAHHKCNVSRGLPISLSPFETMVSEQEGLWIRDGGPTDEEGEGYKQMLADSCGMDQLLQVYQDAYARYTSES